MPRGIDVDPAMLARLRAGAAGLDETMIARRARVSRRVVHEVLSGTRTRVTPRTLSRLERVLLAPAVRPVAPSPVRDRRPLFALGAVAAILLTVGVVWIARDRAGEPLRLEFTDDGRGISVVDPGSGRTLSRFAEADIIYTATAIPARGRRLVVYGMRTPGDFLVRARDARTAEVVWDFAPPDSLPAKVFDPGVLGNGRFHAPRVHAHDITGDGTPELVAVMHHVPWYPSFVAFLDATGTEFGRYYSCGAIENATFFDVDGDGRDETILYGTNNARAYQAGMIVIIDEPAQTGASVDSLALLSHFAPGCPLRDTARARVVFPKFDDEFMALLAGPRLVVTSVRCRRDDDGTVWMDACVGIGRKDDCVRVTMNASLEPVAAELTDVMRRVLTTWPADARERFAGGYLDEWLKKRVLFGAGRPRAPGG